MTPLKKRRDRVRVAKGELPVDIHGNAFPPYKQRLKTSITAEEVRRRLEKTPTTKSGWFSQDQHDATHSLHPMAELKVFCLNFG